MSPLRSPGIQTREVVTPAGGSGSAMSSFAAFIGVAQKGPVNKPVLVRSLSEFIDVFGTAYSGNLRRAADALWAPGNAPGAQAYVVRVAVSATKATAAINFTATLGLTVNAASEGIWGNSLKAKITAGTGNYFTLEVVETVSGSDIVRETYKDLLISTAEGRINTTSKLITVVAAGVDRAATTATTPLAGGADGTAPADNDYLGTSAARTGLNALNAVEGRLLVAIPGVATATVANGLLAWCASRADSFAVLDCPNGSSDATAVTYRTTTLTNVSSAYGELVWPNLIVRDADGVDREVPVSPYRIAAYIRTDDQVGGSHQTPSGAIYGTIAGYLRPASDTWRDVTVRDTLDQNQINSLGTVKGSVVFWGANTLDKTGTFPYANERRVFQEAQVKVEDTVSVDLFRNNDESLWRTLRRKIEAELLPMWRVGGLRGSKPEEAFDIKIDAETNPPDAVARGEVHGLVGLATQKPGLFFYFDFSRKL